MDDEELVFLVKDYPNLYDPSHPKYFDNTSKDAKWDEIGRIMQKNPDDCRNRWKSLRECYRKALRKRESKKMRPWRLETQMDFIRSFITVQRDDESTVDVKDEPLSDEDNQDEQTSPSNDVVAVYVSGFSPNHNNDSFRSENAKKNVYKRPVATLSNGNIASEHSEVFKEYLEFKRFKQNPTFSLPAAVSTNEHQSNPSYSLPTTVSINEHRSNSSYSLPAAVPTNEHQSNPSYFVLPSDPLSKYFQMVEETVRTFPPKLQVKVKSQISKIVHDTEYEAIDCQLTENNAPQNSLASPVEELPVNRRRSKSPPSTRSSSSSRKRIYSSSSSD